MHLKTWGSLALGSRLKALSEALYEAGDEVYRERGVGFSSRWFSVLRLLSDRGPLAVTEVARETGQTHSAVSQLAAKLERGGWVRTRRDASDKRRSLLALTPKAEGELRRAKVTWRGIADEIDADLAEAEHHLLKALGAFEARLAERPLAPRVAERLRRYDREAVRVVPFGAGLREHFYRLNAAWLREYFYLEEIDHRVLSEPEREIIEPGGAVLFALLGEQIVGTCALKLDTPGVYELTKMAVDERYRGLGVGRALLEGAVAEFERRGGSRLFLESSSKLAPALKLYESAGFEHQVGRKPDSHYQRSDVYMIYRPGRAGAQAAPARGGAAPAVAKKPAGAEGVGAAKKPAGAEGARAAKKPAGAEGARAAAKKSAGFGRAEGGRAAGQAGRAAAAKLAPAKRAGR